MKKTNEQPFKADNYRHLMIKYTLDFKLGILISVILIKETFGLAKIENKHLFVTHLTCTKVLARKMYCENNSK